ncbi:MAG: hydantoinase B/oxoprolinase family protein, partial [Gemmatimonadota bacterium]
AGAGPEGRSGPEDRDTGGREEKLPGKVTLDVGPGDVISVRSPGGGGWGREGV